MASEPIGRIFAEDKILSRIWKRDIYIVKLLKH